ncbi:MAG TPA: metallophosphoesterase [Microlunatus sp.]|nr:metallophosphoesterase [Microlunatus sp.]
MSLVRRLHRPAQILGGVATLGAGCLAYAALWEVDAYRLRRVYVPVLPRGARPIRILQISDLHMTPRNTARQRWVASLAGLEPDLVVDTGDNISHPDAVKLVTDSVGRLLDMPGVFVWGSNDYYAPSFKNPLSYLVRPSSGRQPAKETLPWEDLRDRFQDAGWIDLTHRRTVIEIKGVRLGFRGTDDAHLGLDRYAEVAGPVDREEVDLAVGVTHAPYRRVIDAMTYDGLDLLIAGHTHGGQVCVPGYGALVTNCDLDTARVKGLSRNSAGTNTAYLHVSAGLGTSPYAPIRFACPPEATLLTLVPPS